MLEALILGLVFGLAQTDYPINKELKTNFESNQIKIEVNTKVSKEGNNYTYYYSVKNDGVQNIFIRWSALNKFLFEEDDGESFEVKPGDTLTFSITSDSKPVSFRSNLGLKTIQNKDQLERRLSKRIKTKLPLTRAIDVSIIIVDTPVPAYFLENKPGVVEEDSME